MKYLALKAEEEARKALENSISVKSAQLSKPKQREHGDLASNACFSLAKEQKKSPNEIAEKAVGKINADLSDFKLLGEASAISGFVNFRYSELFYSLALKEILEKNSGYGSNERGENRKVLVEFSSPNIGKSMHFGHIRSTVLGDSISNLLEFNGFKTVRMNLYCEAGTQTSKLILAMNKFGIEKVKDERDLVNYYVRISKEIESDPSLKEEARKIAEKMEKGDREVLKNLKKLRDYSVPPFKKNYEQLDVRFDEDVFDTEPVPKALELVSEAIEKKVAFKDKGGEVVADLEAQGLPNLIILRSNGTTLYSTRDLGLAEMDWEKYRFNERIYITASDQSTHFKQVFKILELMGRKYTDRLSHLGFGLVFLEGGKMSTREGRIVFLEDVLEEATESAAAEIKNKEYSKEAMNSIARMVGVGSVKFAVLRITPERNISFNPSSVVSFDADSGAYLQYVHVRCCSILRKAGLKKLRYGKKLAIFNEHEKKLVSLLAGFPLVINSSSESLRPNQLCEYLLQVSSAFSSFYDNCPVLQSGAGEREKRIAIVAATRIVLGNGLRLLGIHAPEAM